MNIYGILLGSLTIKVVFLGANGSAIRSPVMSCEPCLPLISTLPPLFNGPCTVKGTRTASSLSSSAHFTRHPIVSRISRAPVRGRASKVPSPVISTGPSHSIVIRGIIILVKSPDSPICKVSEPFSLSENAPGEADTPLITSVEPSCCTSAPRLFATAKADSLSPHGVYPLKCETPSASAAAIIAR